VVRLVTLAILVLVLVLIVVGCGEGSDGEPAATLDGPPAQFGCDQGVGAMNVDPATARPGGTVGIEVENLSEDRVLTYGLANQLERADGDGWATVELPPTPILEIALIVKPGQASGGGGGATQDRLELPPDLEAGAYRVVKTVTSGEPGGGGEPEALTLCAPFTVEA